MNDLEKFEKRPWGEFHVLLSRDHFKTKWITVQSGHQLSYQSHSQREEHWVIVRGTGVVIVNEVDHPVQAGSYIHIKVQDKHRIKNTGSEPLEFVEVQLGSYFGEDDIVRYADDYRRKS